MRAVVQRVSRAEVLVAGERVGAIGSGLLALVGVTHSDTGSQAQALAAKVCRLRVLPGEVGIVDVPGTALLAVSQFTLYGDTRKGRRPSWAAAAPAERAEPLFEAFVAAARGLGVPVQTGVFGADMRVSLDNEGPVTVLLEV